MDPQSVLARLEMIKSQAHDDESAHSLEDHLYFDILKAISEGRCQYPKTCAELAIKSQDIDFARWCA